MTSVSVILPTRNRSRMLATALRSILWQRDVALEVIVVDEASTDDTPEVVAAFADPRVATVHHAAAQGLSAARNRGASKARGEWLGFLDDDDVWAPDKLSRQVAAAEATGRDWAYAGTVNIGNDLQPISGMPPPDPEAVVAALPRFNPVPGGGSNVIVRRRLFDQLGGFDERFAACADWELWARLSQQGSPAAANLPLVGYRVHSGNMSLDTDRIRHEVRLLEQLHATAVDWGRVHRWLAESLLRMERHTRALGEFAKAALRGQSRGVASDLTAILRRRVRGREHDPWTAHAPPAWVEDALPWLGALDGGAPGRPGEADGR